MKNITDTQHNQEYIIVPVRPSAAVVLIALITGILATLGVLYAINLDHLTYTSPFTVDDFAFCNPDLQTYCDGFTALLVKNGGYIPAYLTGIGATVLFFIAAIIRLRRLEERTHTLRMMVFGPLLILGAYQFTLAPYWDGTLDVSQFNAKLKWYTYIGLPIIILLGLMVIGHTITFFRQILGPGRIVFLSEHEQQNP